MTDLTFFNNLKVVQGKEDRPSIIIFKNQNLQTLLDWKTRGDVNLKLKSGSLQIHNNILLCAGEVKMTVDHIERRESSSDLILNNGGKNKCSKNLIETSHHVWSHDSCAIRWKHANASQAHKFNSYIVQFVPVKPSQTLDDEKLWERDSCSSYGWQQSYIEFDVINLSNDQLELNLTGLLQFTNYAFTVQTYSYGETTFDQNAKHEEGAMSTVKIFRTDLYAPSRVESLKALSKTSSSIQIQWEVTENQVDAIKHFLIDVVANPFNVTLLDRRNFCKNPIDPNEYQLIDVYEDDGEDDELETQEMCCEKCCKFDLERKEVRKKTKNEFEDSLQTLQEQT